MSQAVMILKLISHLGKQRNLHTFKITWFNSSGALTIFGLSYSKIGATFWNLYFNFWNLQITTATKTGFEKSLTDNPADADV